MPARPRRPFGRFRVDQQTVGGRVGTGIIKVNAGRNAQRFPDLASRPRLDIGQPLRRFTAVKLEHTDADVCHRINFGV